jgi:hypothetical protein
MVSGAAALIRAKYPDLSAADVVQRLTSTARDRGVPGRDDTYGYGSLDLMAALTAKAAPSSASSPTATDTPAVAVPDAGDETSGRPLLIIALGVLLLLGAAAAAFVVVRRSRAT